jgi:hypothetical protein
MASIHKRIAVGSSPDSAWDAVRDFGAVHERVAPGFVIDTEVEGDDRVVTFAVGAVARERLVSVDDDRRRLVYDVVASPLGAIRHRATVEVRPHPDRSPGAIVVWTAEVLPDDLGPIVEGLMTQGAGAIAAALAG